MKHKVSHYHPECASKIIVSCCILHNLCINANLPTPPQEPDDHLDIDFGIYDSYIPEHNPVVDPQLTAGWRVKQLIIRSFIKTLIFQLTVKTKSKIKALKNNKIQPKT